MLGENHPLTLSTKLNWGKVLVGQGKYNESEVIFNLCLAKMKEVNGSSHPDTLSAQQCLQGLQLMKNALSSVYKDFNS